MLHKVVLKYAEKENRRRSYPVERLYWTQAINDMGGGKQRIQDVADYINRHHLYEWGDKKPVPVNQISTRLNKYQHMFCRVDGNIWLIND